MKNFENYFFQKHFFPAAANSSSSNTDISKSTHFFFFLLLSPSRSSFFFQLHHLLCAKSAVLFLTFFHFICIFPKLSNKRKISILRTRFTACLCNLLQQSCWPQGSDAPREHHQIERFGKQCTSPFLPILTLNVPRLWIEWNFYLQKHFSSFFKNKLEDLVLPCYRGRTTATLRQGWCCDFSKFVNVVSKFLYTSYICDLSWL